MENSFFLFTDRPITIEIERFHICSWEFDDSNSLIEFGFEVKKESLENNQFDISIFVPWVSKDCEVLDLYDRLSDATNSRFIFNDYVNSTESLDGGNNILGVIHKFKERGELCILPVKFQYDKENVIKVSANLVSYNKYSSTQKPNIYFRFWIKPKIASISIKKTGISKSTIIYDIRVNEKRNLPSNQLDYFSNKQFCKINSCFLFNILPNKYDIVFFDSSSLKNVRNLEYDSFNKYLKDSRIKEDELIVVFNKKQTSESFSFFSMYSKERIGPGQFALAILINIICGFLLFLPSYRKSFFPNLSIISIWNKLPIEAYLALTITLITLLYFIWPTIQNFSKKNIKFRKNN